MKGNCIGCRFLQAPTPIELIFDEKEKYYCSKYYKYLNYRYTDAEYPLVEPCGECKEERDG